MIQVHDWILKQQKGPKGFLAALVVAARKSVGTVVMSLTLEAQAMHRLACVNLDPSASSSSSSSIFDFTILNYVSIDYLELLASSSKIYFRVEGGFAQQEIASIQAKELTQVAIAETADRVQQELAAKKAQVEEERRIQQEKAGGQEQGRIHTTSSTKMVQAQKMTDGGVGSLVNNVGINLKSKGCRTNTRAK